MILFGESRAFWLLVSATLLAACQASKTLRLLPGSDSDEGSTASEGSAGSSSTSASDDEDSGVEGEDAGRDAEDAAADVEEAGAGTEDAAVDAQTEPQGGGGASATAGVGGSAGVAAEPPLVEGLLHRYSFSDTGTTVTDSLGGAHGTVYGGATLDGSGSLTLDGVDDYVALPSGLISSLDSVTMVVWFTWHAQRSWERVFDFGATAEDEDQPGTSIAHFFFTPRYEPDLGSSANMFLEGVAAMPASNSTAEFPSEQEQHIAVVFNGDQGTLEAYVEGTASPWGRASFALSDFPDEHCWLGQSQWDHDPYMTGTYNEFRIYGIALTNMQVRELQAAGPERL
jgi:hypothetical protein